MRTPRTAVLLTGMLRNSPLREALDIPVLCLPMQRSGTVLDAWLAALETAGGVDQVRIVVNREREVELVGGSVRGRRGEGGPRIETIAEPASWRGVAGILRDVTEDLPPDAVIIVGEARVLPPPSLAPLIERLDGTTAGLVGVGSTGEPAGVYALLRKTLTEVPGTGYYDLKEQLLPALAHRRVSIRTATVAHEVIRLKDRASYLAAVRAGLGSTGDGRRALRLAPEASIAPTAVLDGCCVVEAGAIIEEGAVVHDTVVLAGAVIGRDAVVSRCIVGPCASIAPRARIVREIVFDPVASARARARVMERTRPKVA